MTDPVRVLIVAAHPDEADMYAGGTASLVAARGGQVKFLSLTNGDAGHFAMPRKALAERRAREAYDAVRILGIAEYEILDHHDGELSASIKVRKQIVKSMREWQADVVITFHDDCAGHLDNRAAGRATREAVGIATLPNVVPSRPALAQPPVCLLMTDYGAVDCHRHDVPIDVGPAIEKKLKACVAHATQFLENAPHARGFLDLAPNETSWADCRRFVLEYWPEFMYAQDSMRPAFDAHYGTHPEFAETFQLADYGRQTTAKEVLTLLGID